VPIGPSTATSPYLLPGRPGLSFTSLLTAGDAVGTRADGVTPWRMVGVPDGLGALDNGDGTVTVLMNHEITRGSGVTREHGAFVSKLVIDKATLAVIDAGDLAKAVYQDSDGDGAWIRATTAWHKLCSGDLAKASAYQDAASGLGTTARLWLTGEETSPNGRAFGFVVTGADAGKAYELPRLGNLGFENLVANPATGRKTVVAATEDSTAGQVYVYAGDKQATGSVVDKAGLTNGRLYGIVAQGIGHGADGEGARKGKVPLSGSFSAAEIPDAARKSGSRIEADSDRAGVTEWWRPEDAAWDRLDGSRLYLVTSASNAGPSRLWALDFVDAAKPQLGGRFTALLDGSEGQRMFDNITVDAHGRVWLQEDPGASSRLGRLWVYDPGSDRSFEVARHDPARFAAGGRGFLTQDEESSGIIDVSTIFGGGGTQAFLLDSQAHVRFGKSGSPARAEVVEGGQLLLMTVRNQAGSGDDLRLGGPGSEVLQGLGGRDTLAGGPGRDRLDGGPGDDLLLGGAGADHLLGGKGKDVLEGDAGADRLEGGEGDDRLVGGAGADRITGGTGRDTIVICKSDLAGLGPGDVELVTGFEGAGNGAAGGDVLRFEGFSDRATFTHVREMGTAGGHLYELVDGASSAKIIMQHAGGSAALAVGDYLFA
jgi:Ca2+-binding RTX toxin-like protein